MAKQPPGAIIDHLTRRRLLSHVEERRFDLDGDGRLTSCDLLLARSGKVPPTLPELVPETRLADAGQTLTCRALGRYPAKLRAATMAGGKLTDLAIAVRRTKPRLLVEITLPDHAALDRNRRVLTIWISAPGFLPRALTVEVSDPGEPT